MYYLYVKTHSKTNKKYLGQTKQDPYKYLGSGLHWVRHIKKHGNDIKTEVIFQSELKEELIEKGIYYSKLWNIVESDEWLNLKPESGDGGSLKGSKRKKRAPNKKPYIGKPWSEERKAAKRGKKVGPYGPRDPSKIKEPWNKGKKCPSISEGLLKTGSRKLPRPSARGPRGPQKNPKRSRKNVLE